MISAIIQFLPLKGLPEKNLELILELSTQASKNRADLILLPEMSLTGYVWKDREKIAALSESAKGKSFQALSSFCAQHHIYLAYGFSEKFNGKLYNAQNLIGPKGNLLATYRKVHLYDADYTWATGGDRGFITIPTEIGRLGLGICMDLNFDDFINFHCQQSTEYLLLSTNWLDEGCHVQEYWLQRLSLFPGISLIANSTGVDGDVTFAGCSGAFINNRCIASATTKSPEIVYIQTQVITSQNR